MKQIVFGILFAFCCSMTVFAVADEKVYGKMTYVGDRKLSIEENEQNCIEQARINALADKFGTTIRDLTKDEYFGDGGNSSNSFQHLTAASVKGRWLRDTKDPVLHMYFDSENQFIIECEVWGEAREIKAAGIDLKWNICAGTPSEGSISEVFNHKQRLYIPFRSPIDGYVNVYLIDENDVVNCLLPYREDRDGVFDVQGGSDYMFFDRENLPSKYPHHYIMTTTSPSSRNKLVMVFSKNRFSKCNVNRGDKVHLDDIPLNDFNKWIMNCQAQDDDFIVQEKWVKVIKR